mgnify:CR=1 FL=1
MNDLSDLTAQCIRCGFCLESCPTYVETGEEGASPRGRIYLVRSAVEGNLSWTDAVQEHLDSCLGCRACETACPSGVKYGEILEQSRQEVETRSPNRGKKILLETSARPWIFALAQKAPGKTIPRFLSRMLSPEVPTALKPVPQANDGWPEIDVSTLPEIVGEIVLWQGCAMRVLFPRVHTATRRLLRRIGYRVHDADPPCCGALHAHNGYLDQGKAMLAKALEKAPKDLPIIVNSAGCGSWLKDASDRVGIFDISEFLLDNGLVDSLNQSKGLSSVATYHDACHLAHGQGIRSQPRELLNAIPGLTLLPLAESDHCCGSAGIYNFTQPQMAKQLLDRKVANVLQTKADIVVLGNPGCHAWLVQGLQGSGVEPLHLAEILERSFA